MTVPYNDDTRDSYIERMKLGHLSLAKCHFELGQNLCMWQQLFTWVQSEEIYGAHWDKIRSKT